MNDKNNKIFILMLLILSVGILFKVFRNSNDYNFADNRMSYKFSMPTIKSLLSLEYQDHIEDVIADQMPKYNYFKLIYLKAANYINVKTIYLFKLNELNRYIKMGGINLYNDYLIYNTTTIKDFADVSKNDIEEINNIILKTKANIYLYFIETDSNYNFETGKKIDTTDYLKEKINLSESNISSYNISSFDDYKDYFYRTDHHWNYKGSYRGYLEIANLMHFDNVLTYKDSICFDNINSYGSKLKGIANIKMFSDKMCLYQYDFPNFEIYASNKLLKNYGSTIEELKNAKELSYSTVYGGDYGELIFINKESNNNKKLLVYTNSYSNAINKLLAANYSEAYIIDGRYYKDKNMIDYINEKEIDDVLILGNCMLFENELNW